MTIYKIGDKVRYTMPSNTDTMDWYYDGRVCTIKEIHYDHNGQYGFDAVEDDIYTYFGLEKGCWEIV